MEVNAGDIVIKSDIEEEMLADIKETLDGLRAINLKLNLKKCSFGVEKGIFSGHLITKQGIKASLIQVIPEGKEYTYALRFKFKTTNNEAEYEALLAGVRIAKEMRVQELTIFVDS
nr:reverse transcriptase domain-containing protein [Tanacetum cinerariifolium]